MDELDVGKEVILAFTDFVHFDIILRNRRENSLSVLFSFCQRDIKHNTVFNASKLLLADLLLFSMCLTNPLKKYMAKYGKYTDLKTYLRK